MPPARPTERPAADAGEPPEGAAAPTAAQQGPHSRPGLMARLSGRLGPADEREFGQALDRDLSAVLPVFGSLFGAGILLFSAWDYWIAPQQAATTASLRLALVLLGAIGYARWRGRIPVAWRWALVYGTHAGAMILCASLLPGGLLLALPAITGAMLPLALVEPRLRRLGAIVLAPCLLFLVLGGAVLPERAYASSVLVYALMLGLAASVALFQGRLLRKEFLAQRALTESVRHDSLCGVLTRGYLLELAAHDLMLARRYGHPLALGMIDIDHFKRVNDTWGHPTGDALLRAVSKACAEVLRATDHLGRVGGEEFLAVMPETGISEAIACAERMRAAVAALRLATPRGEVRCTISVGVATLAPGHADIAALVAAADAALYLAKANGRDRVELAPLPPGSAAASASPAASTLPAGQP
jgi:diguanylate cyclase (GGDEF)-like protein